MASHFMFNNNKKQGEEGGLKKKFIPFLCLSLPQQEHPSQELNQTQCIDVGMLRFLTCQHQNLSHHNHPKQNLKRTKSFCLLSLDIPSSNPIPGSLNQAGLVQLLLLVPIPTGPYLFIRLLNSYQVYAKTSHLRLLANCKRKCLQGRQLVLLSNSVTDRRTLLYVPSETYYYLSQSCEKY